MKLFERILSAFFAALFVWFLLIESIRVSNLQHSEVIEEETCREKRDKIEDKHEFDRFDDVFEALKKALNADKSRDKRHEKSLPDILGQKLRNSSFPEKFRYGGIITNQQLYSERDRETVEGLLTSLASEAIVEAESAPGGTEIKLIIKTADGGKALMKPGRFSRRDVETDENHFYFYDFERHNAEIAAFHLDRLLGFRRAPPVAGRIINLNAELRPFVTRKLNKTFFSSPAGNVCFYGECSVYCDGAHAICGRPNTIEASMAAFLPGTALAPRKTIENPWKRSYSKKKKANWEINEKYCISIRKKDQYKSGRALLDVIDMTLLDFLIGNMDRHHYEVFKSLPSDEAYPIHMDHGRGFGRPFHDELSILTPLIQCCLIRPTTLNTLINFHRRRIRNENRFGVGRGLGDELRASLEVDVVRPVLDEAHYEAVDRRLGLILQTVRECLDKPSWSVDRVIKREL